MSNSAYYTNDDVISRTINCSSTATTKDDLVTVYEISRCVTWIQEASFRRIALQFPDNLLADAPSVATEIKAQIPEATVFILGDTSYGSCCVDEVGAQHYQADCMIHYGRACLSPTARLPVLYVFGRTPIDIADCYEKVTSVLDQNSRVIFVYDTTYSYATDEVFAEMKKHFKHAVLSRLFNPTVSTTHTKTDGFSTDTANKCSTHVCHAGNLLTDPHSVSGSNALPVTETSNSPSTSDNATQIENSVCKCGRVLSLPAGTSVEDYSFVFIGASDSPALLNMMMTFNKCSFYTYNPTKGSCVRETVNINKALMKRYYLIERAKDASIVGIIAGTLGVAKYRQMIDHLKKLIKAAGKKSYTFVVGKLNPAKLANFAEVDIYVLVACQESSILEQADFYRPVVSPFEMELACNKARVWTGNYSADFSELLPGAADYVDIPASQEEDEADVSLISNKIRTLGVKEELEVGASDKSSVALRSDLSVATNLAQNAGEFFTNRSWQGLERKLGETPVVKATEGQHGIAASYNHEPAS